MPVLLLASCEEEKADDEANSGLRREVAFACEGKPSWKYRECTKEGEGGGIRLHAKFSRAIIKRYGGCWSRGLESRIILVKQRLR